MEEIIFKNNIMDGISLIKNSLDYLYNNYYIENKEVPIATFSTLRHFMNEFLIGGGWKLPYISIAASKTKSTTFDHVFGTTRSVKKLYKIFCNRYIEFQDFNNLNKFVRNFLYSHMFLLKITKDENQLVKNKDKSWIEIYKSNGIDKFIHRKTEEIINIDELVYEYNLETSLE